MVISKLPVICYVQFWIAQIIKIRIFTNNNNIRINFRTLQHKTGVCIFVIKSIYNLTSCMWNKIFSFSLEVIINWVDLGRIPKPNSNTNSFIISINWSLFSLSFRNSFQFLHCGIFFWKPVMLNLVEEIPRFYLAMFLILSTLILFTLCLPVS